MPQLRIKVNSPISPILTLKLVAMATFLEVSGKGDQIGNPRSNTWHMVHIWDENWPSRSWDLFAL